MRGPARRRNSRPPLPRRLAEGLRRRVGAAPAEGVDQLELRRAPGERAEPAAEEGSEREPGRHAALRLHGLRAVGGDDHAYPGAEQRREIGVGLAGERELEVLEVGRRLAAPLRQT